MSIGLIYSAIQLILKLFGAWESFLDYSDNQRRIETEAKRQAREKAVDNSTKAETDEDIWKSQDEITRNMP